MGKLLAVLIPPEFSKVWRGAWRGPWRRARLKRIQRLLWYVAEWRALFLVQVAAFAMGMALVSARLAPYRLVLCQGFLMFSIATAPLFADVALAFWERQWLRGVWLSLVALIMGSVLLSIAMGILNGS